jgi:hypothetical protein
MEPLKRDSPSASANREEPPPYTEIDPNPPTSHMLVVEECRLWFVSTDYLAYCASPRGRRAIAQLRRWLTEIMAFTFEADPELLAAGVQQSIDTPVEMPSILSDEERATLLDLAHLIKSVHARIDPDAKLFIIRQSITQSNQIRHIEAISKPAYALDLDQAYVMEVLSSYTGHQCRPEARSHTLVSIGFSPRFRRLKELLWLGRPYLNDTLAAHARIVARAAISDDVCRVLEGAMVEFKERNGVGKLGRDEDDLVFSYALGFWELGRALTAWV